MSEFLEKSSQSLNSAKILATNYYYASTVNRSYYACFQYLMHVLFVKIGKDQGDFYKDVRASPNGTHSLATKLVGIELAKINMEDYKWFQKEIPQFREKRIDADYYPSAISQYDGQSSITKAEAIINVLKKNFK